MTKQTIKPRSQEFFSTTISALLRGMVVLLLFTHQAWADVICCGANDIESQRSCHQTCEENCSSLRTVAESSEHYTVALAEAAKPPVEVCFADQSQDDSTCCESLLIAEPQRRVVSASEQIPLEVGFALFAMEPVVASAQASPYSPPSRSRPIFLITSCFII